MNKSDSDELYTNSYKRDKHKKQNIDLEDETSTLSLEDVLNQLEDPSSKKRWSTKKNTEGLKDSRHDKDKADCRSEKAEKPKKNEAKTRSESTNESGLQYAPRPQVEVESPFSIENLKKENMTLKCNNKKTKVFLYMVVHDLKHPTESIIAGVTQALKQIREFQQ